MLRTSAAPPGLWSFGIATQRLRAGLTNLGPPGLIDFPHQLTLRERNLRTIRTIRWVARIDRAPTPSKTAKGWGGLCKLIQNVGQPARQDHASSLTAQRESS